MTQSLEPPGFEPGTHVVPPAFATFIASLYSNSDATISLRGRQVVAETAHW
jgi:hypothetical protein